MYWYEVYTGAEMLDIIGNDAEELLNREINRILKNGIL